MDTKALFKLTYGLYVVGVRNGDDFGGCVVDAVMQTTVEPPTLVVSSNKSTRTNECIAKTKEFSLSVLSETTDPFVIANFGFQSCRAAEKWNKVSHRFLNGLPVLNNAAAYLHCRVTDVKELSTHTLFFCDITEAVDGTGKALPTGLSNKLSFSNIPFAFHASANTFASSPFMKFLSNLRLTRFVFTSNTSDSAFVPSPPMLLLDKLSFIKLLLPFNAPNNFAT